jgi:hypothetical protein
VRIYAWLLLFLPWCCEAYILGSGTVELGISVEKEKHNFGLASSYDFSAVSPRLESVFASQTQLGTNVGRSTKEINEHDYQYENSYIDTRGELNYLFPIKGIKWNSGYSSKIDFIQSEELDPVINSNFDDTENSWFITTGPSLIVNKNNGFVIETSIDYSYMDSKGEITKESNSNVSLNRSITPVTQLGINSSRVCLEYEVASENDICRIQHNITFSSNRANFDLNFEVGLSDDDDSSASIYSSALNYTMNRYSDVSILVAKSTSTIKNSENSIFEVNKFIASAYISSQSFTYNYNLGGAGVSINYLQQILTGATGENRSVVGSVNLNYRLGFGLCAYCILSANHDYSSADDDRVKNVSSIVVTKINTRRLSTSINLSQTRIKSEIDIWSIGMLFTYSGQKMKLGGR